MASRRHRWLKLSVQAARRVRAARAMRRGGGRWREVVIVGWGGEESGSRVTPRARWLS